MVSDRTRPCTCPIPDLSDGPEICACKRWVYAMRNGVLEWERSGYQTRRKGANRATNEESTRARRNNVEVGKRRRELLQADLNNPASRHLDRDLLVLLDGAGVGWTDQHRAHAGLRTIMIQLGARRLGSGWRIKDEAPARTSPESQPGTDGISLDQLRVLHSQMSADVDALERTIKLLESRL